MTATLSTQAADNTVIKSANDQRDYAYSVLDNGFKLLVISDVDAQRAAVSVDVGVGSSAEPDDFPGLAHFLEHMLFLGTDKYPDPDDYINYISDHGGHHNAFTAFDHTNYFFDIDPAYLHQGLQRFSRFFVAPLMAEKYVARERNAVDSEYQSKLREDAWRSMDVFKQAINPKHPYSRFSIGNNRTLPEQTVRPALLAFYKKYYSAERMSAVIIGKEDVNTLMSWGKTLFADVVKRPSSDLHIKEKLFADVSLPIKIKSQSIKNEKNLSLFFQFPYRMDNEYSKSLGYLSHILGYEGKGSLLEALKTQGYASELYSGAGYRIGDEISFEIGVQLTDKGYAHPNNVVAMIFAYLDLLKNDSNGQARYQEIATVAQTAFQFKEKRSAVHEVSGIATRLNRYPVKDVQRLEAIFSGYNAEQIKTYLDKMTADKVVLQFTSPSVSADKKTQYFSVPYEIIKAEPKALTTVADTDKKAVAAMHLPKPNPFIADNYQLQKSTDKTEKHTILTNGIELFFKNDTAFNVPRSSVQISLQPVFDLTVIDKTTMTLLAELLNEQLTTTLYDASIAGLHAEIAAGEKSLAISLQGYQQRMPVLLQAIIKQLNELTVDKPTFARIKANYRQELQNAAAKMPYQQTFPYLNANLVVDASLPSQRLSVLDGINEKTLTDFADKALSQLAVRMLVYGNQTEAEAEQLGNQLADLLANSQLHHQWQPNQARILSKNISQSFSDNHSDSAITYYIQGGKGYAARGAIGVLAKLIEPQFFTRLRTEKQLGYVVFAYPQPTFEQAGIAFTIQSPVADADVLEKHIDEFKQSVIPMLDNLSETDFAAMKTILRSELLQKPENLASAANRYWSDILTTGKTASSRHAIANAIEQLSLADFTRQMRAVLSTGKKVIIKGEAKHSK